MFVTWKSHKPPGGLPGLLLHIPHVLPSTLPCQFEMECRLTHHVRAEVFLNWNENSSQTEIAHIYVSINMWMISGRKHKKWSLWLPLEKGTWELGDIQKEDIYFSLPTPCTFSIEGYTLHCHIFKNMYITREFFASLMVHSKHNGQINLPQSTVPLHPTPGPKPSVFVHH